MKGTTIIQNLLALPALAWVVGFNFYFQPHHLASHHQSHDHQIAQHQHHDHHHQHGHNHHHSHDDEDEPEHTSDDHDQPSFIQAKQKENAAPTFEIQALAHSEITVNIVLFPEVFSEHLPDKELNNKRWFFPNRGPPLLLS